ncbi:acyl-CoA thioesterase [Desulfobacterales bacterium HSG17]|nr:acyl-CoA thioesterase [Desulfobacterales bacterium HSG17]
MNGNAMNKEPESMVRIRFQDCDPFGHLNNAKYIDYFINAREDHLANYYQFDIYERQKRFQTNWVIFKHHLVYLSPCYFRENVTIKTHLLQYSNTTLLMEGVMTDAEQKRIKAIIWTEFRYFDLAAGKPARHDDALMRFWDSIVISTVTPKLNSGDFDLRVKEIMRRHTEQTA